MRPMTFSRSIRNPWCRGRYRLEVDERVRSDGTVLKPLDPEDATRVVAALVSMGVESVAVCLLNSFENPAHELMIKEIIEKEAPHVSVSVSYHVLPQIREYERTSTTVTNAYVKPLTGSYLARLSGRLESIGCKGRLFIMLSSGGITSVDTACPVSGTNHRVRADRCGASPASTTAKCSISRTCSVLTWAAPRPNPA